MVNTLVSSPESLVLFHGSLELKGEHIKIGSGSGIGWNGLTFWNAFYTSMTPIAARLFSHLVLQKSRLDGEQIPDNSGFAKIYTISLNKDSRILNAENLWMLLASGVFCCARGFPSGIWPAEMMTR